MVETIDPEINSPVTTARDRLDCGYYDRATEPLRVVIDALEAELHESDEKPVTLPGNNGATPNDSTRNAD